MSGAQQEPPEPSSGEVAGDHPVGGPTRPDTDLPPLTLPDVTIAFVRHGESTWIVEGRFQGRGDPPLSSLGERQAALVGARLHDPLAIPQLPLPAGPPRGIWHSPLTRTRQTAEAIAAAQPSGSDAPLRPSEDLLEIGQGAWEGLLHAEVASRYGAELAAWRRSPTTAWAPGGEPLAEVGIRVRRALGALLRELGADFVPPDPDAMPASRVLGPSAHRAAGRHADAASAAGAPPAIPWAIVVAHDGVMRLALMTLLGIPFDRFWSFPFALCAIGVLDIRGGIASIRAHNLTDHLAPLEHEMRAAAEARGDRTGAL
jgi:probable phosphoglycerate mutase